MELISLVDQGVGVGGYRKYHDQVTLSIVVTMMMREREVLGITAVMYTGGCHTQSVPSCTHQDHHPEEEEEDEYVP